MRIGVIFPQTEIGTDPAVLRDYAQTAEGLGFSHILAYDHVLGADPSNRPEGSRAAPYTHATTFHEPISLFSWMAGITERIEFVTGILILPQRQTALVAKQAATLDLLSGGRLRLGIGIGWNRVEYEALNQDFSNRGARSSEQVQVLRKLWTEEVVDYTGRWHRIDRAGINPLPVQRPIPIWFGGSADQVIKRIARLGDGWFPQFPPGVDGSQMIARLHEELAANGRKPADVGIEGRLGITNSTPDDWARAIETWRGLGATHMGVNTMGSGLAGPRDHIAALQRIKDGLGALV